MRRVDTNYTCNICNSVVANNPQSKSIHENGAKHKAAMKEKIEKSIEAAAQRKKQEEDENKIIDRAIAAARGDARFAQPQEKSKNMIAPKPHNRMPTPIVHKEAPVSRPPQSVSSPIKKQKGTVERDAHTGYGLWEVIEPKTQHSSTVPLAPPSTSVEADLPHLEPKKGVFNDQVCEFTERKERSAKRQLEKSGYTARELDSMFTEHVNPGQAPVPAAHQTGSVTIKKRIKKT